MPMKLKTAAMLTAATGDRTFVATMVAIEFAESWKPFTNSKLKVMAMVIAARRDSPNSSMKGTYEFLLKTSLMTSAASSHLSVASSRYS